MLLTVILSAFIICPIHAASNHGVFHLTMEKPAKTPLMGKNDLEINALLKKTEVQP